MNRFISHDGLAAGVFNRDCTAQPVSTAWSTQLTNTPDLLELLCSRLENDFVNLRPNMRKAFTGKDVEICLQVKSLASRVYRFVCQSFVPAQEMQQRRCGIFLHAMACFEKGFPKDYVDQEKPAILKSCLELK